MQPAPHAGPLGQRRIAFVALAILSGTLLPPGLAALALGLELWDPVFPAALHRRRLERWTSVSSGKQLRMGVVGDSFLEAWPFSSCLQRQLFRFARHNDMGLDLRAMGGMSALEYQTQGTEILLTLRPQLMVVFYNVGNDLTDVLRDHRSEGLFQQIRGEEGLDLTWEGPPPRRRPTGSPQPPPPHPAAGEASTGTAGPLPGCGAPEAEDPSAVVIPQGSLWSQMVQVGIDRRLVQRVILNRGEKRLGPGRVNGALLLAGMEYPAFLQDNVLMESRRTRAGWAVVRRNLKDLSLVARAQGATLLIVAIPSAVQVSRAQHEFFRKAGFYVDDRLLASDAPQRLLAQFCRQQGVLLLDLLAPLRAHPRAEQIYWPEDDHFSPLGHQVAFQLLRERILDGWAARLPTALEAAPPTPGASRRQPSR